MKPIIKPYLFIGWFILPQLMIYMGWSFVLLDLIFPLTYTFCREEGRALYLVFIVATVFCGAPSWCELKEIEY